MTDEPRNKATPPHLLTTIKDQLDGIESQLVRIEDLNQRILYESRAPGGEWLSPQELAERLNCGIDAVRAEIRKAEADGSMVIFDEMKMIQVGQGSVKPRYRIWLRGGAQGERNA